jgi:hypothetical protein
VSALELRRLKRASPWSCDVPGCTRRGNATERMATVATYRAFICGRPDAYLCKRHADVWRAAWDEAVGGGVSPERQQGSPSPSGLEAAA